MKTLAVLCLVLLAGEAFGAATREKRAGDSGSDSNGDGNSDSSGAFSSQDLSDLSAGSGSDSNGDGDSDSSDGQSSGSGSQRSENSGSDSNNDGNSDSSLLYGSNDLSDSDIENSGSDTNNDGNSDSSEIDDGDSDIESSSFESSNAIDEKGSNSDSNNDGNSDSSAEGGLASRLTPAVISKFADGTFDKTVLSPALRKIVEERINGATSTCVNTVLLGAVAAACRLLLA